jgi:hypothetical protein
VTFTGNNAADTISIQDDGAGVISGTATGPGGGAAPFGPFFNIRQVNVNTNGGDDTVTYQFTGDMLGGPFAKRRITVNLGQGEDKFLLDASADIDLGKKARLNVQAFGGIDDGRDQLTARYEGEMDGRFLLTMHGGDGNDNVSADVLFDQGSAGRFRARLFGDAHDDVLNLLVHKANTADPILIDAVGSGGANNDILTRTPLAADDGTCEVVNIVP